MTNECNRNEHMEELVEGLDAYSQGIQRIEIGLSYVHEEGQRLLALLNEREDSVDAYAKCFTYSLDEEVCQVIHFVAAFEKVFGVLANSQYPVSFSEDESPEKKIREGFKQAQAGLLRMAIVCETHRELDSFLVNLTEFEGVALYNPFKENGVRGQKEFFERFAATYLAAVDK